MGGHQVADLVGGIFQFRAHEMRHKTADAGQQVDTWILASCCQFAIEHNVSIEDRSRVIGDRIIHIVAFDENGVKRGNAALRELARSFEEFGHQ